MYGSRLEVLNIVLAVKAPMIVEVFSTDLNVPCRGDRMGTRRVRRTAVYYPVGPFGRGIAAPFTLLPRPPGFLSGDYEFMYPDARLHSRPKSLTIRMQKLPPRALKNGDDLIDPFAAGTISGSPPGPVS